MAAGTQRIVFEVDVDNVPEFQAALERASRSLKDLGDTVTAQQARSIAGDKDVEASNQGVAGSYQRMAEAAMAGAAEQSKAAQTVEAANRGIAESAAAAAGAQEHATDEIVRGYEEQAVAAKLSADAQEAANAKLAASNLAAARALSEGAGRNLVNYSLQQSYDRTVGVGGESEISGVRGTRNPGSITNPIVVALEAARYTGMGALAAAIGQESASANTGENRAQATRAYAGATDNPELAGIASAESYQSGQEASQTASEMQQTAVMEQIRDLLASGAASSSKTVDIFHHSSAEAGGGGNGNSILPTLLAGAGGGASGRFLGVGVGIPAAGMGSILAFAGLGIEHVVMTVIGVITSALMASLGGLTMLAGGGAVMGVGAVTDLAGIGQAAGDIKNTTQALSQYQTLQQALAEQVPKTAKAQQALNQQLDAFAPAARAAVLQASLTAQQFHAMYDMLTAQAEATGAQILQQAMQVGEKFLPTLGMFAAQNMKIMQQDLQPLFAWLNGPEMMGIFQHLEMEFQQNLPTAINAFTQALEFVFRYLNLASNYSGGFLDTLNRLFTRLNSMDNFQINAVIQRLVNDFKLWDTFVKLLVEDIGGLFRDTVGQGNSVIQTLNGMLEKLHQWLSEVQNQASLETLFTAHKNEVIALLHLLPLLVNAFGPLYLAVAPALTTAFTAVLRVFEAFVHLMEQIPGGAFAVGMAFILAKLGLLIPLLTKIRALIFGTAEAGTFAGLLGGVGAKAAGAAGGAGAVEGAGAGAGAGALATFLGPEATGILTAVVAGAATTVATAAAGALAIIGIAKIVSLIPHTTPTPAQATSSAVAAAANPTGPGQVTRYGLPDTPQELALIREGAQRTYNWQAALQAWSEKAEHAGTIAHMTAGQLDGMVQEGQKLEQHFAGTQAEAIIDRYMKPLESESQKLNLVSGQMSGNWKQLLDSMLGQSSVTLPQITDAFDTNMRLIDTQVGEGSAHAKQLMATNLANMVTDVTRGMADGTIKVKEGMSAIQTAMTDASKQGVNATTAEFQHLFDTLNQLFQEHKIDPQQYFDYLQQLAKQKTAATTADTLNAWKQFMSQEFTLWQSGDVKSRMFLSDTEATFKTYTGRTVDDTLSSYQGMFSKLSAYYASGRINLGQYQTQTQALWKQANDEITANVQSAANQQEQVLKQWRQQQLQEDGTNASERQATWKQYWNEIHSINQTATSTAHQDMSQWATQILNGMIAGGSVSLKGADAIAKQLNELLQGVGASKIPVPTGVSISGDSFSGPGGAPPGHMSARGSLWQVGQPGDRGRDSVPMNVGGQNIVVGAGEQVAVFTHQQQAVANQALAPMGGLGGLFSSVNQPHYMAAGGYVFPFVSGWTEERVDQGQDASMPIGSPIGAIGDAVIVGVRPGASAGWDGGPYMQWRLTSGPMSGREIYLAEEIEPLVHAGQTVRANQAVARFGTGAGGTTGIEMGWATSVLGQTLAAGLGEPLTDENGGKATAAGTAFHNFLLGLAHGKIIGGGPGGGGVDTTITAPRVEGHGLIAEMVQKSLDKGASAATAYATKKIGSMGIGGGGFNGQVPNIAQGPVEKEMYEAGIKLGLTKLAIAGMIGNAYQESRINPNLNVSGGRGLFSWDPSTNPQASQVQLGNVAQQMALAVEALGPHGGAQAFDAAATSPAAAAIWFEENFEAAGVPDMPNRIAGAEAAYRAGYKRGGPLGGLMALMMATGGDPNKKGPSAKTEPGGQDVWSFIHQMSPGFPVKDLGASWLNMLGQNLNFSPVTDYDFSPAYLKSIMGGVNSIINTQVPKMQEREQYLAQRFGVKGGQPHGKHLRELISLDQGAVAWLLRGTHDLERLIGMPGKNGPLDNYISHLQSTNAKGSEVTPLTSLRGQMQQAYQKLVGLSGIGGMLGDAENSLEQLIAQGGASGKRQDLLQLLQEKLQYASEKLALERSEDKTLRGLMRSLASGQLPELPHGGAVMQSGLAMIHQGEFIVPDQQGPYGTQGGWSQPSQPVVNVHFHDRTGQTLEQFMDMCVTSGIENRAPGVVSRELGRRKRMLSNAPGRPPQFSGRRAIVGAGGRL